MFSALFAMTMFYHFHRQGMKVEDAALLEKDTFMNQRNEFLWKEF